MQHQGALLFRQGAKALSQNGATLTRPAPSVPFASLRAISRRLSARFPLRACHSQCPTCQSQLIFAHYLRTKSRCCCLTGTSFDRLECLIVFIWRARRLKAGLSSGDQAAPDAAVADVEQFGSRQRTQVIKNSAFLTLLIRTGYTFIVNARDS